MLSLLALSCAAAPTNAVSPYLPSGTNLTQEEIAASHEAYFKSPRKPEFMPRPAELYGEDVKSNFIESTRRGIRFNDVPDGVEVRFRNGTTIIKGDTNSLNVRAHCYKLVWCDPTPLNPNCDPTYTVGCQVKEMRVNPTLDYIEDPAWGHYRVVQKASYGSTSMTINHGITVEDTWSVSLNVGFELEGATTGGDFDFSKTVSRSTDYTFNVCVTPQIEFWFYAFVPTEHKRCGWINYYTITTEQGDYEINESGDDAGCVWEPLRDGDGNANGVFSVCRGTGSPGTACGIPQPGDIRNC